ncbi:MAG: hypothetical protein QG646_1865 [Euryarchaeota archaeon]|nr:hypothetical protein [Euryarchaeota archaeon]
MNIIIPDNKNVKRTSLERYGYNLPKYVICSDNKRIPPKAERYLPKQYAQSKPYIVVNNPKYSHYIAFDVDREDSMILWELIGIPAPTLVVQNKANYHSHYLYELQTPLPARDKRTASTNRLLDAVIEYYKFVLCSHKAIVEQKQLAKNALCDQWGIWGSDGNCGMFTLSELGEYTKAIPRRRELSKDTDGKDSRNCYLFNQGRYYAYDIIKNCDSENELFGMVWAYLNQLNDNEIREREEFSHKGVLLPGEIKDIAKSISRWVWDNRHNFGLLKPSNRNLGALGLAQMGKGWNYEDSKAEVKKRQRLGAEYCHRIQKEKTEHALWLGVQQCREKALEITTKNVSELSGINIRTVYRYVDLLDKLSTE